MTDPFVAVALAVFGGVSGLLATPRSDSAVDQVMVVVSLITMATAVVVGGVLV